MNLDCMRCGGTFTRAPTAHPPRFCDLCQALLDAHATGKERQRAANHRWDARRMAQGKGVPE